MNVGKLTKRIVEWLQVIQKNTKLQEPSMVWFWGIVPMAVWLARDHFVPLTMRVASLDLSLERIRSRLVRGSPSKNFVGKFEELDELWRACEENTGICKPRNLSRVDVLVIEEFPLGLAC